MRFIAAYGFNIAVLTLLSCRAATFGASGNQERFIFKHVENPCHRNSFFWNPLCIWKIIVPEREFVYIWKVLAPEIDNSFNLLD